MRMWLQNMACLKKELVKKRSCKYSVDSDSNKETHDISSVDECILGDKERKRSKRWTKNDLPSSISSNIFSFADDTYLN